jgi:polyhydroxyalkanoate synthase
MTQQETADLLDPDVQERCRLAGERLFERLLDEPPAGKAGGPALSNLVNAAQWEAAGPFLQRLLSDSEALRLAGETLSGNMQPDAGEAVFRPDRRFDDSAWSESRVFGRIRMAYDGLVTRFYARAEQIADPAVESDRQGLFVLRLLLEAVCPANSLLSNPRALRAVVETGGQSLATGLENLVANFDPVRCRLPAPMSPRSAFHVGQDLAVTPGHVVAENDLCQLLLYEPQGGKVHAEPVLVVPPWINKFYILDLRPDNSLVRWLTRQGYAVFLLSWVNPDAGMRDTGFGDYLERGLLEMGEEVKRLFATDRYHAMGYCLGGTLLATAAAWHAAGAADHGPASLTFLTTMLDFSEPGDLGAFISEPLIEKIEERMEVAGYLDGSEMSDVFAMLRSSDLYWSFFIGHYLLGREPRPFDILHWNADNTRMPAAMHGFYLRNMYLENNLVKPSRLNLAGRSIDLGRIGVPSYFLATAEDHIAPWRSAYRSAGHVGGDRRFVLAGSGHVAGVVNPPDRKKYGYRELPLDEADPDSVAASAQASEGSWWVDWLRFLDRHSDPAKAGPESVGESRSIEPAPGRYVLEP